MPEATDNNTTRWFRSSPQPMVDTTTQIDNENGILFGVVMCQVGEAKGHGIFLEQEFIDDLIAYDKRFYTKIGLKSRFGHPGMSSDTMGTQLGVYKNFRVVGEKAVADLHLLKSADLSPTRPDMGAWVLSMAEEMPTFIMSSIVFKPGRYYQKFNDGSKRYCWEYQKVKDSEGYEYNKWISEDPTLGNVYVEFGKKGEHYFTDLVEEGAATDSLFSAQFNSDKFAVQASEFFREHPHLIEFLQKNPARVLDFFKKIGVDSFQTKPKISPMQSLKDALLKWAKGDEDDEFFKKQLAAADTELTALRAEKATWASQKSDLESRALAAEKQVDDLNAQVTQLSAEAEKLRNKAAAHVAKIEELSNRPGQSHTDGKTEGEEKKLSKTPAWDAWRAENGL